MPGCSFSYREACLLTFGFCTGLRISDLLNLKVSDIITSADPLVFKPEIDIHEQKTGKRTVTHLDSVLITEAMQESFARYAVKVRCTCPANCELSYTIEYGGLQEKITEIQDDRPDERGWPYDFS